MATAAETLEPSVDHPDEERLEEAPWLQGVSHRFIIWGEGIRTWSSAVQTHFLDQMVVHSDKTIEQMEEEMLPTLDTQGYYYTPAITSQKQALVVVKTPTEVKTKTDIYNWLVWWIEKLETTWRGCSIEAIISPNKKYDAVVKMTAGVLGIDSVLEDPQARATGKFKEHEEILSRLRQRGAKLKAWAENEEEEGGSVIRSISEDDLPLLLTDATYDELVAYSEPPRDDPEDMQESQGEESGQEEEEKLETTQVTPERGMLNLPATLTGDLTPMVTEELRRIRAAADVQKKRLAQQWEILKRVSQQVPTPKKEETDPEEEEKPHASKQQPKSREGARKHKSKSSFPKSKMGPDEYLPDLSPMPQGVRRFGNLAGFTAYHWIGSPMDIDSHALMVLTDENLKVRNRSFRVQLNEHAGKKFREEVEERRKRRLGETEEERQVVIISGQGLPHYAVLCLPIEECQGPGGTPNYRERMLKVLEKGLDRAKDYHLRRVVICVDGLRSGPMQWEEAEKTAMALVNLRIRTPNPDGSVNELVIVTSEKQDQERRRRALTEAHGSEERRSRAQPLPSPAIKVKSLPEEEQEGRAVHAVAQQALKPEPSTTPPGQHGQPVTKKADSPPQFVREPVETNYQESPPLPPRRSKSISRGRAEDSETGAAEPPSPRLELQTSPPSKASTPRRVETMIRQVEDEESKEEIPEEEDDLLSVNEQTVVERKELKMGRRKGEKKDIEIFDVHHASERLARDIGVAPVKTKDGRQAYVPEAGQTGYEVPEVWRSGQDKKKTLEVTATAGEWANILMMPFYTTLTKRKELTSNFRTAYTGVAHDVLLRKMKTAALAEARRIARDNEEENLDDEEDERALTPTPQPQTSLMHARVPPAPAKVSADGQEFTEFKKIKALVRPKGPNEEIKGYLKEVWCLVEGSTECESAKRLWLSHITSHPIDRKEDAKSHYARLVLEDEDDEEAHISRARAGLEQGQTLAQVWHGLKEVIIPKRYVKALRAVTKGHRGEVTFVKMPTSETTVTQMNAAVKSWDLEHQFYEEKRKKEAKQLPRAAEKQAPKPYTQVQQNRPQGTPNRGPASNWRQQQGAQASPAQPKPTPNPRTADRPTGGDDIYTKVDGEPYLVDSGAEVSMTRKSLETKGHLRVLLANGSLERMPFGIWMGIVWLKGPYNLITPRDMKELQLPQRMRRSLRRRLDKLQSRVVRLEPAQDKIAPTNWYKPVDIPETTEQKVQESDFSPAGKEKLKQIIGQANVARFKNDCGDLGAKYIHTIEGGVHPPVRQYPLNPGAVEEMDKIVRELSSLGIIREEASPITNSPIQAVKKPESAGGGWRPVINFKALNRRTIANRASLINPQGTLKTLQVKKYKSCIDLANGFFSLRLAKQSQGKTAFTHKGKAYVWQRLPQGYKNSPNVFQSAVMDVLKDEGVTIYIDDVFIADDTEEEHLEKLQRVTEKLTAAGLKLNLKKCQFGQFKVTYLGFQVSTDLGLSEGYKEKLEQITPPRSENDLQKILGLCNYVRDHVPHYQRYAKPLYACLRKKQGDPEGQPQDQWIWTATDQENLEKLKKAIREAGRLEPRSLTTRLVAEISCEDDDAMVKVHNEGAGMVTLWSYTLSSVEKKYPQEEKELAVLAKYWGALKELAQGQAIKVVTQSQVHRFLRKGTIEGTKATNARWGRWEDILLDPDLELGPTVPVSKKPAAAEEAKEEPYEWVLYTDGSKKGQDNVAYWGYILKHQEKERHRQKGRAPGSAQAGEVTAILEGLLELGKRKVKRARIITDSHYCAQALKEDLTIWEENGFEGAKGKSVAHQDLWKKIAELRLTMELDVVHQKAHGKEGAHWRGNDEVDRYVQQRRIVFVGIEKWEKTPKGKVVPEESVEEVVRAVHEALGHAGTMPTRKELEKQQLWIPGDRVRRILKNCEICGRYNAGRRGQRVDGLTIKSTVPWGSVCMDVAGPLGVTGKRGEKYLLVLVDSMSGYVVIKPVRKANGSSVVGMLEQVCQCLGVPKELRTDNGTHFRNAQVDQWCQQRSVIRVYSPPYTPQANGVVERTIGLVKNWIGKNANTKEWSIKAVEVGQALNDRSRADRPSPAEELNQRPFTSQEVGRDNEDERKVPGLKVPFYVGQRVWIKARDHPTDTAVKAKYETSDIVEKILDSNTVLLKKKGIQGVAQLKPIPS
ncbi:uncharacterized protein V6R79_007992 [Siganus canaliculatus]